MEWKKEPGAGHNDHKNEVEKNETSEYFRYFLQRERIKKIREGKLRRKVVINSNDMILAWKVQERKGEKSETGKHSILSGKKAYLHVYSKM